MIVDWDNKISFRLSRFRKLIRIINYEAYVFLFI